MKPVAGRHQESSDREVLAGLVERVTFHNPENGFCVLRTRARFIRTAAPSSVEGIEKHLGSGMIRGIGPVYARKL